MARAALLFAASLASTGCATPDSAAVRPPLPGEGDALVEGVTALKLARPVPESPVVAVPSGDEVPFPLVAGPRGEVVSVSGRVIGTAELGAHVLQWHPDVAAAGLQRLVRIEVIRAEAARQGVTVPEEIVRSAAERALDERCRQLRLAFGAGSSSDALVRRATGRTIAELRGDLREAVFVELLAERLARLAALRQDGVDLRILVVPDERPAATLAAQWRAGADGGLLAARLGLRPPAAPGPMAVAEVPDGDLRGQFAAAADGTVIGPVPFEAADPGTGGGRRTWWQVFRVVRRWDATSAGWQELGPRVETWLREVPATPEEVTAWERRAIARAGVRPWRTDAPRE